MTYRKTKLDRLLSGGPGPSVQEKEAIFAKVLKRLDDEPSGPYLRYLSIKVMVPAGVMLAVVMFAFLPMFFFRTSPAYRSEFLARGNSIGEASMRLACKGRDEAILLDKTPRCHYGDTLIFSLQSPKNESYFSAAALGVDGLLIWYFPSEADSSLAVNRGGIIGHGIVLGKEHLPGRYRVIGVYSPRPLSREEMRDVIESFLAGQKVPYMLVLDEFTLEK